MTAWQATLRRRFDRAANGYEALAQLQQQSAERLARELLSALPTLAASTPALCVLDLGCGTGWLLRHLQTHWRSVSTHDPQSPELFALDLSEGMLRAVADGPALRVCADATALPFAALSMDLLVSNFALHWCDDPARVLADMHRITRSGGQAFCVIPVAGSLAARGEQAGQGAALRDISDWQLALAQSPWQPVSSELETWVEYHDTPASWLATLRALGVTARRSAAAGNTGLAGRAAYAELQNSLERAREPAGIPLRYQVWRVQLKA